MSLVLTTAFRHHSEVVLGGLLMVLAVVTVILLCSIPWMQWFRQELRYVNDEIKRNEGKEKARWQRRKRRLMLSIIPFVRYR